MDVLVVCSPELLAAGGSAEDRLLREALEIEGHDARLAAWDRLEPERLRDGGPDAAGEAPTLVVRSCWDYAVRLHSFERWLARLGAVAVPVVNPVSTLRWNLDKGYLLELEAAGVAVTPTVISGVDALEEAVARLRADPRVAPGSELVVKPTVGATASGLVRLARGDELGARDLASPSGRWLLQPFLESVEASGEWSVVAFAGAVRYAVRKRPATGDFRVQSDFGGTAELEPAPDGVLELAERTLAACRSCVGSVPLMARVDIVEEPSGPLLMELELIEPELFLTLAGWEEARALASVLNGSGRGAEERRRRAVES